MCSPLDSWTSSEHLCGFHSCAWPQWPAGVPVHTLLCCTSSSFSLCQVQAGAHLLSVSNEALRQLVYVALHSPHVRVEEVGHHAKPYMRNKSYCESQNELGISHQILYCTVLDAIYGIVTWHPVVPPLALGVPEVTPFAPQSDGAAAGWRRRRYPRFLRWRWSPLLFLFPELRNLSGKRHSSRPTL